jgi:hypothetical protein
MPYDSLEVRWFFDGALDEVAPEVLPWFRDRLLPRLGGAGDPLRWPHDWRDDRYVVLADGEKLGIKLREGRIEIKGRIEDFGQRSFTERIEGSMERWAKWSNSLGPPLQSGSGSRIECPLASTGEVVLVKKKRAQRRLVVEDGSVVAIPMDQPPVGQDVRFEITRIGLGGATTDSHWSIAFEAAPYTPGLHEPFRRIVASVLADWPIGILSADRSMAYPAWLARRPAASRSHRAAAALTLPPHLPVDRPSVAEG